MNEIIKKLGTAQHDHPFGCESPEVVEKINEIIDVVNRLQKIREGK